ncbi:MAG TPA: DoxX family protein [Thermoanaerobaculia bacterium]|nr:DoxX family protein [Thermoanaerobaculia bacterium]
MSRARRVFGNVFLTFPGLILIASSFAKFARVPAVAGPLANLGFFGERLQFIAVLEVVSALLFLIPRTRAVGLVLVSAYMGGAIAAHLGHGEPISQPAVILVLFWVATTVRHPEALWSFARERDASAGAAADPRLATSRS